jgi:acetoin utilization protein AcuC
MSKPLAIAYSDQYLDWQLGAGSGSHPTNPVRAKLATEKLVEKFGDQAIVIDPTPEESFEGDREALAIVHSEEHIHAALDNYVDSQWSGANKEVAEAGFAMFRGTVRLVEKLLAGEIQVGFNPQGAKHHARRDGSSGFCVYNDMAYAALKLQEAGLRPLYLDWDIHAGDGVHHILKETRIPTLSIHQGGIYPLDAELSDQSKGGTRYTKHDLEAMSYNWNLRSGDGDDGLEWAMAQAGDIIDSYKPDVILLAAGADGHEGDNNLGVKSNFSYKGFLRSAKVVASLAIKHCQGRVIIGGAGGYQPLDHTPEIWSQVVSTIYSWVEATEKYPEVTQEDRNQMIRSYSQPFADWEIAEAKAHGFV